MTEGNPIIEILRWIQENIPQNAGILLAVMCSVLAVYFLFLAFNFQIMYTHPFNISFKELKLNLKTRILCGLVLVPVFIFSLLFFFHIIPINNVPIVDNLSPNYQGSPVPGIDIEWTAKASDKDINDRIYYQFLWKVLDSDKWNVSQKFLPGNNQWKWKTTGLVPGDYTVMVQVKNNKTWSLEGDKVDELSNTFILRDPKQQNQQPLTVNLKVNPESPQDYNTHITWTATASDDPVSYKFVLKGDRFGSYETDWSGDKEYSWSPGKGFYGIGEFQMQVRVRDNNSLAENDSNIVGYTIIDPNKKPYLTSGLEFSRPSPHKYKKGETIWINATAIDPENDKIFFRFKFDKGNDSESDTYKDWPNGTFPWKPSLGERGKWNITVCIRDGKHAAGSVCDDSMSKPYDLTNRLVSSPRLH